MYFTLLLKLNLELKCVVSKMKLRSSKKSNQNDLPIVIARVKTGPKRNKIKFTKYRAFQKKKMKRVKQEDVARQNHISHIFRQVGEKVNNF